MTKLEFISRQLAKAESKRYEHYVVTRVWHLLNDLRIKLVTQQYISRPSGRAMTDMYFPQLEMHIEIDEGHHKKQIEADKLREADIINATGHTIFRIDVTKDIEAINREIDKIIQIMKYKLESAPDFKAWDLEAEQSPQTYIERGYIDLKDDVAFRTISDAASCFGKKYLGLQRSYFSHPTEPRKKLWFPKLYKNGEWNNQISNDEETIISTSELSEKVKENVDKIVAQGNESVIVFPRVKSPLADLMYRFKGEYKLDLEASNYQIGLIYRRIATRVKTYPQH
jgi:very-short-patch-repair endonuclease